MSEPSQPLADTEFRFDRMPPEHEIAAAIWEYCREWMRQPKATRTEAKWKGRMATIAELLGLESFPSTPWLDLAATRQKTCAEQWRIAPGELESYDTLAWIDKNFDQGPRDATRWREALRNMGCVCFELGRAPRDVPAFAPRRYPTRAALLARFEAWLDANPEWWEGRGTRGRRGGTVGKRDYGYSLRFLAWRRIARAYRKGTHKHSPDGAAREFVAEQPEEFRQWLNLPVAQRARRRWGNQAFRRWLKLITNLDERRT